MGKYVFMAMTFIILAGCSENDEPSIDPEVVQFSGIVLEERTKTGMSGSTASFIPGDQVGVFETLRNRNNVCFSYNGSVWGTTTPMYWYNGSSTHTFYSYYPYSASSQGPVVTMPLLNNQTVGTVPDATCDMLIAGPKTQARSGGTGVTLNFTHAFTLLQFNIKMGILNLVNPYVLETMTIRGGNTAGGSSGYGIVNIVNGVSQIGYDVVSKTVQTTANNSTTYTQTFVKNVPSVNLIATPISVYAIVLPGSYQNPVPAIKFKVSLLGIPSETNFNNLSNTTFSPNTKYIYDVKIGGLLARENVEIRLVSEQRFMPAEIERQ